MLVPQGSFFIWKCWHDGSPIKTMLCGHFIGIDKLERLKLLQKDPLVNEFDISKSLENCFLKAIGHQSLDILSEG
jgi:hypothetical protein